MTVVNTLGTVASSKGRTHQKEQKFLVRRVYCDMKIHILKAKGCKVVDLEKEQCHYLEFLYHDKGIQHP